MRQRRREWILLPWLVIVACIVVFAYALHQSGEVAQALSGREDQALATLRTLESAQRTWHEQSGRYGWLDELALPHPRRSDGVGSYFEQAGYRFDALLPARRQMTQAVTLSTQAAKSEHRELRARHFVVLARPLEPGVSGYRTFYLDETGLVWIHEGVSDEETARRNPLPIAHLSTSEGKDMSGRVWVRLDTMVPRGQPEWDRANR